MAGSRGVHHGERILSTYLTGKNAMTMISHSRPVGGLFETFQEATVTLVTAWIASYQRRRQRQMEQAELLSLDPRTLADMGVEFAPEHGPSMFSSQADAVTAAMSAMAASGQR